MGYEIVLSGVTFNTDDFLNYGWLDTVTVLGAPYARFQAIFAAGLGEIEARTLEVAGKLGGSGTAPISIVPGPGTVNVGPGKLFQPGQTIQFVDPADPTRFIVATVTAYDPVTGLLTYNVPVNGVSGTGSLTAWNLSVTGQRGADGAPGGIGFTWDTNTADTDPGSGRIRANNASLALTTTLFVDLFSADGMDVTAWLDGLGDSTSTNKGRLILQSAAKPAEHVVFNVSAVVSAAGYRKLVVAYVSGTPNLIADEPVVLGFSATGDKGDTGVPGPTGSGSSVHLAKDGVTITTSPVSQINFTGSNITVTADGGVSVTGGSGTGGEKTFTVGATISAAGKAVALRTDGKIEPVAATSTASTVLGAALDILPAGTAAYDTCVDPVSGKIVVVYKDPADSFIKARVVTISGSVLSVGADVTVNGVASGLTVAVCADPSGRVLVMYANASDFSVSARVCGVSGTTLSVGTAYQVFGPASRQRTGLACVWDASASLFVLAETRGVYYDISTGGAFVVAASVSGGVITTGTATQVLGSGVPVQPNLTYCAAQGRTVFSCITYEPSRLYSVPLLISGLVIALGFAGTNISANGGALSVSYDAANSRLIYAINRIPAVNSPGSGEGWAIAGTLDGTTIILGPLTQFAADVGWIASCYDASAASVMVQYFDRSDSATKIVPITGSGLSAAIGSSTTLQANPPSARNFRAVFSTLAARSVFFYALESTTVVVARAAQNAGTVSNVGQFIGFSKAAGAIDDSIIVTTLGGTNASQAALTTGRYYYLTQTGDLTTTPTSAPVGFALSATEILFERGDAVSSGGSGSVDWSNVPQAISSTVTSTGGAGPSDTTPLLRWRSADSLWGYSLFWKTGGNLTLEALDNGVVRTLLEFNRLNRQLSLGGARGREMLRLTGTVDPTRRLQISATTSASTPALSAVSDDPTTDPNVPYLTRSQGSAGYVFGNALPGRTPASVTLMEIGYVDNPESWIKHTPGATGSYSISQPVSSSADASYLVAGKGAGSLIAGAAGNKLGFFGDSGALRQTINSADTDSAKLQALLTALAAHGLITLT